MAKGDNQALKESFAGCVGGIVQVMTGQPFDTVKVRLQTQPDQYSSMVDCVKKTLKNEGFKGFYKGALTPLIGIGACVSIQFSALESAKRYFIAQNASRNQHNPTDLSYAQLFLSGSASGVANSVLSGPIEHVRSRLQIQARSGAAGAYAGPIDFFKRVYGKYGLAGIYKGQGITLVREFGGYGIYFLTYEALMKRQMKIQKTQNRGDVAGWMQCLFGACSGYTLWTVMYPIDAIKSKIQTDSFEVADRKYKGVADCVKKVLAAEGVMGFYRGFVTCMLRAGPVNGFTFMAYEATMRVLA
ncbi:mitochondrial carrier [Rhizoclosmatium globosum]|uniref:Mitochondrial carrier n=1 Tax=Rhizoclosmatium globosum TaxID=329046 RepID=A0A1Y2BN09_9FUNG|nr:Mitochondrial carrier protein ymc2 [Rhizoclosmatium hyalinum]KAJ3295561.1 Mitochondrial carrier protein ymc2 [Rhizoclosmatium sp. JEL0117]ORY36129.1 mitochondrial carrier [Rhizoclosmatium globosum]|eukprot:ORY36129.1 mitochondrial carrier [Rhizoclosmatium globosum]